MKDIENYLKDNKTLFDSEEPNAGHFERFGSKLNVQDRKKTGKQIYTQLLRIAAVFILLVLSSLWVYDNIFDKDDTKEISRLTFGDISPEYKEAEIYYTSIIDNKCNVIKNHNFTDDSFEKEILLNEIAAMDTLYKNLQNELNTNPNDERIITAIIEHYKLKVKVLNTIIENLNYVKPQNNYNYETIEL